MNTPQTIIICARCRNRHYSDLHSDHLHAEHIKLALLHNKHVVCTKPFIDDLSKARELLRVQRRLARKFLLGKASLFEPYKRQRKDFEEGVIGELITVESHYNADHRWFLEKKWALEKSFKWLYGGLSRPLILFGIIFPI